LDAALKANRLRSTLTVFERSKFFFNLPGTLLEAIEAVCKAFAYHFTLTLEQGRFEAALLAYKKGQYMLDGRPQPLLGLPPSAETTILQEQQAKRIYDKVRAHYISEIG
jgi:exocyst complex component 2